MYLHRVSGIIRNVAFVRLNSWRPIWLGKLEKTSSYPMKSTSTTASTAQFDVLTSMVSIHSPVSTIPTVEPGSCRG